MLKGDDHVNIERAWQVTGTGENAGSCEAGVREAKEELHPDTLSMTLQLLFCYALTSDMTRA